MSKSFCLLRKADDVLSGRGREAAYRDSSVSMLRYERIRRAISVRDIDMTFNGLLDFNAR